MKQLRGEKKIAIKCDFCKPFLSRSYADSLPTQKFAVATEEGS